MITLPPVVMKTGQQVSKWFVKNGPTLMSVGGGVMAIVGAVMACEATLHADDILDEHKAEMEKIAEAQRVCIEKIESGEIETADQVYSDKQVKHDKALVYAKTAGKFVKLYAPAVTVGLGGIGLMQGAFAITEKRRSAAVSALASLNEAYTTLAAKAQEAGIDIQPAPLPEPDEETGEIRVPVEHGEDSDHYHLVLPEPDENSFSVWFQRGDDIFKGTGNNCYVLNTNNILSYIRYMNTTMSSRSKDHFWFNNLLEAWGKDELKSAIGHHYGWNAFADDQVVCELSGYKIIRDNPNEPDETALLIEMTDEDFDNAVHGAFETDYCILAKLKTSRPGYPDPIPVQFIHDEVYGK